MSSIAPSIEDGTQKQHQKQEDAATKFPNEARLLRFFSDPWPIETVADDEHLLEYAESLLANELRQVQGMYEKSATDPEEFIRWIHPFIAWRPPFMGSVAATVALRVVSIITPRLIVAKTTGCTSNSFKKLAVPDPVAFSVYFNQRHDRVQCVYLAAAAEAIVSYVTYHHQHDNFDDSWHVLTSVALPILYRLAKCAENLRLPRRDPVDALEQACLRLVKTLQRLGPGPWFLATVKDHHFAQELPSLLLEQIVTMRARGQLEQYQVGGGNNATTDSRLQQLLFAAWMKACALDTPPMFHAPPHRATDEKDVDTEDADILG